MRSMIAWSRRSKSLVQTELNNGDISFASNWVLPTVVLTAGHVIAANEWNGERLFQAAKFGTETEYSTSCSMNSRAWSRRPSTSPAAST